VHLIGISRKSVIVVLLDVLLNPLRCLCMLFSLSFSLCYTNKQTHTHELRVYRYAEAFEKAGCLDKLEAFSSFNGPDFYGLPRNNTRVRLTRGTYKVPKTYGFGDGVVKPLRSDGIINWSVKRLTHDDE